MGGGETICSPRYPGFDRLELPKGYGIETGDKCAVPAGVTPNHISHLMGDEPHPLHYDLHFHVDQEVRWEKFEHLILRRRPLALEFRREP